MTQPNCYELSGTDLWTVHVNSPFLGAKIVLYDGTTEENVSCIVIQFYLTLTQTVIPFKVWGIKLQFHFIGLYM